MTVMLDRDGSDFTRTRRLGLARFETQIRKEVRRWEAAKPCLRIARKVFAALTDPAGVLAHRAGAVERVALVLHDWHQSKRRCADIQTRMTTLLDELKLTELVTSIPGLSPVGAAAILAETGNLHRFTSARALVKHAGLAGDASHAAERLGDERQEGLTGEVSLLQERPHNHEPGRCTQGCRAASCRASRDG